VGVFVGLVSWLQVRPKMFGRQQQLQGAGRVEDPAAEGVAAQNSAFVGRAGPPMLMLKLRLRFGVGLGRRLVSWVTGLEFGHEWMRLVNLRVCCWR
jgi:hypothetical protein